MKTKPLLQLWRVTPYPHWDGREPVTRLMAIVGDEAALAAMVPRESRYCWLWTQCSKAPPDAAP